MRRVYLLLVMMMVVYAAGCRCPDGRCVSPETSVVTIKVDKDQNFVVDNKVLTAEAFFDQATFAPGSNLVHFDVLANSAITEATIIRAIDHLEARGFKVSMLPGSKYESLNAKCKK